MDPNPIESLTPKPGAVGGRGGGETRHILPRICLITINYGSAEPSANYWFFIIKERRALIKPYLLIQTINHGVVEHDLHHPGRTLASSLNILGGYGLETHRLACLLSDTTIIGQKRSCPSPLRNK